MTSDFDQTRVSVSVALAPEEAFRVFTEEIDQWWLRGRKFRASDSRIGTLHLEAREGGRLFEQIGQQLLTVGTVTVWRPPSQLVLEWRGLALKGADKTEIEVRFEPSASGTLVTVTHRGWSRIAGDHPVRHGQPEQPFLRSLGLWWGELLSSLRARASVDRGPDRE
jgi:Activator of Hsp90 ATPase homolog 1-like protein